MFLHSKEAQWVLARANVHTVVYISNPVFVFLSDKKDDGALPPAVVMPTPSKRGRKSKQVMGRVGGILPTGSDALILAHLAAGGQVRVILS